MRRFLGLFRAVFLGLFLAGCAGMEPAPIADRSLQKVHDIDLKKDEIYSRSLEWLAKTFTDSKAVIEMQDKDSGKIIGKGVITFTAGIVNIPCRFTMSIEAKDGRYRTTYSNFTGLWDDGLNSQPLEQTRHIEQVKADLTIIDADLLSFLSNKRDSDW